MEIKIITDGWATGTKVYLNGERQDRLKEFSLSVKVGVNGKSSGVKMQLMEEDEKGRLRPSSLFGGDFEKFDVRERTQLGNSFLGGELKKEENYDGSNKSSNKSNGNTGNHST